MLLIHYSLFFHFIGIGMLCTSLFAGWALNTRYRQMPDWKTRVQFLKALRLVGLFSPAGVVVMVASGIVNMYALRLWVFSEAWLSAKLVLFAIMIAAGIPFAIRSGRRTKLARAIAEGHAPEDTSQLITAIDRQLRIFYVIQTVLLLVILALSIVKPHT